MNPRKSPAANDRAIPHRTNGYDQDTRSRRQDGYAALDAEDRLDAEVLAAARERGFRLAIRCARCGQWLVAADSVAAHLGPRCRQRAEVAQ